MTTRREVLKMLAAAGSAGLLPRVARALPWSAAAIDRIGLQLYTVRAVMRQNVAATLEAVAKIGYREVEFAGYFQASPGDVRRMLDDNGLTSPSCHVSIDDLRRRFDATVAAAQTVGHRYLTLAWLDTRERGTLDDWKRLTDAFNDIGRRTAAAGLKFAYHNHDFEYRPIDGQVPMDVLLGGTDASLVAQEMDLYWTTKAGYDPRTYFARFPGRFEMVHVKDSRGAPNHEMTEVGAGTMDWAEIFARRAQAGIQHYFVEHDAPADPMNSIRASFGYLRALRF